MNTYSNPLTDYSPQMEFYGGTAGGHFHRKRRSGVPADSGEMELATEFMDAAVLTTTFNGFQIDGSSPGCTVWRTCCCIGPVFFDTDMSLMKNFRIPRWEGAKLQVGAQAFNLLNHPNFDQPINDIANSQCGSIVRTVGPPTSLFGAFLGGDASRPPSRSKRKSRSN